MNVVCEKAIAYECLGGTFMGDQLIPVDASGLEIMLNATTGTSIGDGEFNVYTDIDLRGGSTLLLDGTPAVFSNWVEDASNNIKGLIVSIRPEDDNEFNSWFEKTLEMNAAGYRRILHVMPDETSQAPVSYTHLTLQTKA